MADLSWLTEAVNKTRDAQLNQQKMVAIPLFNQIGQSIKNMQAPVTPQVQQLFQMIQQRQKQNPVYVPFKTGTPTLAKQQFTESTRQWEKEFEEDKRRWEAETEMAKQQQAFENQITKQKLNSYGSSSSSGSSNSSKKLTKNDMLLQYYEQADKNYEDLKAAGYKYPLYYTISSILRDPNWKKAAIAAGFTNTDIKNIINSLIATKGNMTPQEYFNKGEGKKLKGYYDSLSGSTNNTSGYLYEISGTLGE